jgi:hypothetical protein
MPVFHTSDYQMLLRPVSGDRGLKIKDLETQYTNAYQRYIVVDKVWAE